MAKEVRSNIKRAADSHDAMKWSEIYTRSREGVHDRLRYPSIHTLTDLPQKLDRRFYGVTFLIRAYRVRGMFPESCSSLHPFHDGRAGGGGLGIELEGG